jgi:osmotically-inducible protein OsmY
MFTIPSIGSKSVRAVGLIVCLGALPVLVGVTGCASSSSRYTQSKDERSDDHATSSRVSTALANDSQHRFFEGVNVETFKDVVQLSGFVNTHALKQRAGDIARGAAGGREVRNNIAVKE